MGNINLKVIGRWVATLSVLGLAGGIVYATIMQGESTPGVYPTVKVDSSGKMFVNTAPAAAAALGFNANVSPYGTANVSTEPSTLFAELFDGAVIDVTDKWNTGGTNTPTQGGGQATLSLPATINLSSTLITKPIFNGSFGFELFGATVGLEPTAPTTPNFHKFWGLGQVTAYTYATPLTDALGFEEDGTGAVSVVVYIAGTRYVINSTTPALITPQGSLPTGASSAALAALTFPSNIHRYAIIMRGDIMFFYIDKTDVPVAYATFLQPQFQNLPARFAVITNSSGVVASTFTIGAVGIGDTSGQNRTLSDGTFQWRKAQVNANGSSRVEMAFTYNHISTSVSTVVKSGTGTLHALSVNTKGTVASTITVYDNTACSGNVIGIVDSLNLSGIFIMDVTFNTGLCIATTGTVAPDVTVSYR